MPEIDSQIPSTESRAREAENSGIRTITLVNRTDAIEKRARKLAKDQYREEKRKLGYSPKHWIRRGLLWAGEEFFKYRGIKRAREAMLKHNNAFVDVDVMRNVVKDSKAHLQDEKAEAKAKIEQVGLNDQVKEDKFQKVEKAKGSVRQVLINEVIRPVVEGKITTESGLQDTLRSFMQAHTNDKDQQVREQIENLFGSKASQHTMAAEYFATDIMEAGNEIKKDIAAHKYAIDQLDQKVQIQLANTNWGADTKSHLTMTEKITSRIMRRPAAKLLLNEVTLGTIAGLAAFSAKQALPTPFYIVGGIGAGEAAVSYIERNRMLKEEMAEHKKNTEYGRENQSDTRSTRRLERYRYRELASIHDMLDSDDQRNALGGDSRSLKSLLALDVSPVNEQNREAVIRRIAEMRERLRFSSSKETGFIRYEEEGKVEQGRLALIKGIVEGKRRLVDEAVLSGMDRETAQAEVDRQVQKDMGLWEQRFIKDKKEQDRAFTRYRMRSAAGVGVVSSVAAVACFFVPSEILQAIRK